MKAEPFVKGLNFGEGLRWHEGRFWYSDFHQHRVSSAAPDGTTRVELEIDDRPSGIGWLPDGRLLVVAMISQRLLRRDIGQPVPAPAAERPAARGEQKFPDGIRRLAIKALENCRMFAVHRKHADTMFARFVHDNFTGHH